MNEQLKADAERSTSDLPLLCRQFDECSSLPIAALEGALHIMRHVTPSFCNLVGKTKEDLLGKPFAEAAPAASGWLACLDRVYLTGESETYSESDAHAEQEDLEHFPLYWLFSLWPVHAADGRPMSVVIQGMRTAYFNQQATEMNQALMLTAVRYDELQEKSETLNLQLQAEITEHKHTEARHMASLRTLSDLQAAVDQHAVVTITDPQGRITYANDKFCAASKYAREELLGQDHRIVNAGFHPKEFIRKIWEAISSGKVWKGDIKGRAKDGQCYWMETTIVPCLDAAGTPFQYVAIRTDITARSENEIALQTSKQSAEQGSRAKDEFIAALSHELRTPLTPILLIASSLEADERLDPALHSQMELIRRNAELEALMIDDLLDVTKITRGKILLRSEQSDIHQLLFRAFDTVGADISHKGIIVEIRADARYSRASADPSRIQQVFWNVIKNSAKFTPEGGRIQARTFNPDPRTLTIEIRDTGIGIAPEHLPSLFVPFEQGAATGIQRFGGLGLGLAITKAIVELHGGSISASSAGVGHGSTFTIVLPVSESVIVAEPPAKAPEIATPSHLHILLVEDHEHTRTIMARLLRRDGHEVEAVGTCREARQAAEAGASEGARPFQAIISDLGLPDCSGLDLVSEIRALFPEINAVAVSGYGTDDDLRKTAEAGFNHHLVKPIGLEALRRALVQEP